MKPSSTPVPPKPTSKPTAKPDDAGIGKAGAMAWMVQTGTFRDERNARALEDKLRALGFHVQVGHTVTATGFSYKVLVGPEASVKKAEELRAQLLGRTGIKGVLVGNK